MFGVRSADRAIATGRPGESHPHVIARLALEDPFGAHARGVLVGVPELPEQLLTAQAEGVASVSRGVAVCHAEGATIVGLGAVAAVIGGQGKAIAEQAPCPVSTGNGFTALAAVETLALFEAQRGARGPVALIGPPGPVASGILQLLADRGRRVTVIAERPPRPLVRLAERLTEETPGVVTFADAPGPLLEAGHVLVAASSTGGRLKLSALPAGSVVIDVAAPQDVLIDRRRRDVLLLDGEYVRLPSRLGGSLWREIYALVTGQGRHVFACYAEPMLFALSGRHDLCSVGRDLPLARLHALADLAARHGFFVDQLHERGRPVGARRLARFRGPGPG